MRIAYLTQSYPPMISGAALVVERLATAMAQRGHQVLVIAASDKKYPYHVYKENLTIVRLNSIHNPMRENQRFLLFPHFEVLRALKTFQPDIIHAHEPLQTAWTGIAYTCHHHIPTMLTVHLLPSFVKNYLPNKPALQRQVESVLWTYTRWLIKHFTSVIAPSYNTSGLLASITGIQAITLSNGVDLQTFHPPLASDDETATRIRLNLPSNVPIILSVGRLDTDKRVDCVIHASAPALQQTNAHLLIVGDGCEKNSLVNLCHSLGITERVHFTNVISDQQYLSEIYRIDSLFITASEIETQGIVLLEAAASGLPIVAVNATCISEIVHNRVNGFLAEPNDPDMLSDALSALISNPQMAEAMGRKSRILAEKHDIHNTWQLHEGVYKESIVQAQVQHAKTGVRLLNQHNIIKNQVGSKQ